MAVDRRKKGGKSEGDDDGVTRRDYLKTEKVKEASIVARNTVAAVALLCLILYIGIAHFGNVRVTFRLRGFAMLEAPEFNVDAHYAKYLWGSYRPNVYFGLRAKTPTSPLVGLMYFSHHSPHLKLRHTCENSDNMKSFGWVRHDGASFGQQLIHDEEGFVLKTEYVKQMGDRRGGTWTARVSGEWPGATGKRAVSIILYTAAQAKDSLAFTNLGERELHIEGRTDVIGNYAIDYPVIQSASREVHYWSTHTAHVHNLTDLVKTGIHMGMQAHPQNAAVLPDVVDIGDVKANNFVSVQMVVQFPFTVEMTFSPLKPDRTPESPPVYGRRLDNDIRAKEKEFDTRFEDTFGMATDVESSEIDAVEKAKFAKYAFSNLLGGIGYFYGQSKVIGHRHGKAVHLMEVAPLLTAVPSRTYFPRGFLWDEGFHLLLIQKWDAVLAREIVAHWFDLINVDGWIAREQILGDEAQAKVPKEFIVQNDLHGNPPALLLVVEQMLDEMAKRKRPTDYELHFFQRLYPRLNLWLEWYNRTQTGDQPLTYRWHSRNQSATDELNPKTLASGLDDYPRASHPGPDERHLDLWCWMHLGARVMSRLAKALALGPTEYDVMLEALKDNTLLDSLHWSPQIKQYADWGRNTDDVKLTTISEGDLPRKAARRQVNGTPELGHVPHFGYVSLFPVLLEIADSSSEKLGITLDKLRDPNRLWTDFGLRSLSKDSTMYLKHNTLADEPYWRGPVWINLNYLAVRALQNYGAAPGPYAEKAKKIAQELKQNLVRNMLQQYRATGYIWESYDVAPGKEGKGRGSHPFTGWSSLVVLLMGDN